MFEVRRGADIVYMSGDGQYVFTGDLYHVPSHNNLTEAHRRVLRQKLIDSIPESQMVIFSPPQPKYTVTVFTDVDCAYCRELHRQIADYNRLGVRVRYVFYPRTGPNTESWRKAEQVWCSADRKSALTRAKLGQPLDAKPCAATPVEREYAARQGDRSRRHARASSLPTAPWLAAICRRRRWSKSWRSSTPRRNSRRPAIFRSGRSKNGAAVSAPAA